MNKTLTSPSTATAADKHAAAPHRPLVLVKELSERARWRLLKHFLALDGPDRMLRFGSMLSNERVTDYVEHLDFKRDRLFGVYDWRLKLVGVGHLAFAPVETRANSTEVTDKLRVAELGVSVALAARGAGVGTKLFERAAIHCRNADVDTLYMHCLAS